QAASAPRLHVPPLPVATYAAVAAARGPDLMPLHEHGSEQADGRLPNGEDAPSHATILHQPPQNWWYDRRAASCYSGTCGKRNNGSSTQLLRSRRNGLKDGSATMLQRPEWQRPERQRQRIEGVRTALVVGSGKGGVGKSTVSVNLALALARRGLRVGLFDADVYGPSVPLMLGVRKRSEGQGWHATLPLGQRDKPTPEQMLQPVERHGVRIMSVGFFIGEEQAAVPSPDVLGILIRNLLQITDWGDANYLIVDLPPGTGEPQATLCRELALDGALLVTTPQDVARMDTAKALSMFR